MRCGVRPRGLGPGAVAVVGAVAVLCGVVAARLRCPGPVRSRCGCGVVAVPARVLPVPVPWAGSPGRAAVPVRSPGARVRVQSA